MLQHLGVNTRNEFENNSHKFNYWLIIASYTIFKSNLLPIFVFAVEENENKYHILQYQQENNGKNAYCEIAEWIAKNLGVKKRNMKENNFKEWLKEKSLVEREISQLPPYIVENIKDNICSSDLDRFMSNNNCYKKNSCHNNAILAAETINLENAEKG
jgi:hypothetical protein